QPILSETGREMILAQIIRNSDFNLPRTVTDKNDVASSRAGWRRKILELLDDLRAGPVTAEHLMKIGPGIFPDDKFDLLVRVFTTYEEILDRLNRTDQAGHRQEILRVLKTGKCPRRLAGMNRIMFQDFERFTPFQIELIKSLAQIIPRVQVNLSAPRWLFNLEQAATR
ncbi:MAG: hypothetical protein HQK55_14435, partial [Deltaproteobacteria bacterium]|nr:hypothetical protein [Deltaproteobacteria bacterium]